MFVRLSRTTLNSTNLCDQIKEQEFLGRNNRLLSFVTIRTVEKTKILDGVYRHTEIKVISQVS
jgi:hypothetical protein